MATYATDDIWYFWGTSDGDYNSSTETPNGKSFCSKMSPVSSVRYDAICTIPIPGYAWYEGSCPKGWGKNRDRYPSDTYSVKFAQGYIDDNKTPIYNTVTKYRDTVYNYTAGRIAKA